MPHHGTKKKTLTSCLTKQVDNFDLASAINKALDCRSKKELSYFSISISIPNVDPLAVLEQNPLKESFEYFWEQPNSGFSIVAAGELERVQTTGRNRYKEASALGKNLINRISHFTNLRHSLAVPFLLGGFSFNDHNISKQWKDFGAGSFTLPEWMILREGKLTILTIFVDISNNNSAEEVSDSLFNKLEQLDRICKAESYSIGPELDKFNSITVPDSESIEHQQWINSVNLAKKQIKNGLFSKIVLARELPIPLETPVSDTHILNRLRHQYPDCYSFLIRQNADASFIGCTPERLASFNHEFILTEGLAGSTPRGKTASEDAKLESELLKSEKDMWEHSIVLDAIKKELTPFSDELVIPDSPEIKKLSNVQHLHTPVRAHIKDGVSKTEVLKSLHPTPAVGGFPKDKAVPFISQHENFDRGWYASPIGWINANGDGEFAVGIRSGIIKKDEVRFYAGCGIVEGSDPEKEWAETNLKFIPMLSALEYASN